MDIWGIGLFCIGVLFILHPILPFSYFTYTFLLWGVIFLLDGLNQKRHKTSLMKDSPKEFWGITVPASVIFWLFFEFGNFRYIQWAYFHIPHNEIIAVVLTMVSFATVIPFATEMVLFLYGPFTSFPLTFKLSRLSHLLLPFIACLGLLLFLLYPTFVSAQTMWFVPFFLFFPFIHFEKTTGKKEQKFLFSLIGGILLSGLIWETLNFWANTGWQYLIIKSFPHLFAMPIIGYFGYIPFVFSLIATYLFLKKYLSPTPVIILLLNILALAASILFVRTYFAAFHIL